MNTKGRKSLKYLTIIQVLVTVVIFFTTNEVKGQEEFPVKISGTIRNAKDSTPIANMHLIRFSDAQGTVSDQEGNFTLGLEAKSDSFMLSAVGFGRTVYNPPDSLLGKHLKTTLYIKPKTYSISAVEVVSDKHRELNVDLTISDEELAEIQNRRKLEETGGRIGIGIEGPITKIYNLFSKEAREERLLNQLQLNQKNREFLAKEPYRSYIESEFNFHKEKKIKHFLGYCEFEKDLTSANYYEVVEKLEECYRKYRFK